MIKSGKGGAELHLVPDQYLLVYGDGAVRALVNAGAAVNTILLVDNRDIGDLNGRLRTDVLASSASNTFVSVDLCNQV
jgi:hypothetical protein